jgi:septal ring factor EnvC (AmiA/AmiB activator)
VNLSLDLSFRLGQRFPFPARWGTVPAVTDAEDEGIKQRLQRQGEEALGRLAEELAGNPLVTGALQRAFEAREKAAAAQNVAMGALNIPSAADIERLTRRLRSVSQRLEAIEDTLDRVEERMQALAAAVPAGASTDEQVLERLDEVARDIAALREALAPADQPVPRAQERLSVSE